MESWYNAELSWLINKVRTEYRLTLFATLPSQGRLGALGLQTKPLPHWTLSHTESALAERQKQNTDSHLLRWKMTDDHSEVNYGISPPPPPSQSNTQIEMEECNSKLTSRWMNLPRKRVWICLFRFSMERREEGGGEWGWFCLLIS